MFTAKEARELAGPTVQEKVEQLLLTIKEFAKAKKRSLRTSYDYQPHNDLWVNGGYSGTEEWKAAKKILEELGYKVSFYYECRQFVDMYTLIEW